MVALLGRGSQTVFLHSIFTGFGASYKLTSSWTPSWPGTRADTSWALFSLYKVNYTPGGCHSLHKWGKPEMKPYDKITCQHRDSHWGNPAELRSWLWMADARLLLLRPLAMHTLMRHTLKVLGLLVLLVLLYPLASGAYFWGLSLRTASGPHCKAIWD